MKRIVAGIGLFASAAFLMVSGLINARFGYSLGQSPFDAQVYAGLSAASDVLKAVCVVFLAGAWADRKYASTFIATTLFVLTTTYSLTSAIGFNAVNRDTLASDRELSRAQYNALTTDLAEVQANLNTIPQHRAAAIVEADLSGKRQHHRWTTTRACTDATLIESRSFCQDYHRLEGELAAAMEADRLLAVTTELQINLGSLEDAVTSDATDPQLSALSKITGLEEKQLRKSMNLLLAVLSELGSGLGLFLTISYFKSSAPVNSGSMTPRSATLSIDDFVRERIAELTGSSVTGGDLFGAFKSWVTANNATYLDMTNSRFGRLMGERFTKKKVGGRIKYFDIQLVS